MARHKNINWDLAEEINGDGRPCGLARRQVAVLMDIRDELQTLNSVFACRNFLDVPQLLRDIKRNTTKRKRKPAVSK